MCDTWPHHRLLHADELRNAPSPFFISSEKSLLKVIWARADSPALGLAVRGGELFGLLTWMNCWSNVEAGNGWIVYINMINIALINHLSVIYCRFSHLALTGKLWRISQWSCFLSSQRKFWVSSGITVLRSTNIMSVNVPRWFFTGLCLILLKELLWRGKTVANGTGRCARTERAFWLCSSRRPLRALRTRRVGSLWARFGFGVLLFEPERCVFKRAIRFPVKNDRLCWKGGPLTWPASSLVHPCEHRCPNAVFCNVTSGFLHFLRKKKA